MRRIYKKRRGHNFSEKPRRIKRSRAIRDFREVERRSEARIGQLIDSQADKVGSHAGDTAARVIRRGAKGLGTKVAGPLGYVGGNVAGAVVGDKVGRDINRTIKLKRQGAKRYKRGRERGLTRAQSAKLAAKKGAKSLATMRKAERYRAQKGQEPGWRGKLKDSVSEGLKTSVPGFSKARAIKKAVKGAKEWGQTVNQIRRGSRRPAFA